MSYMTLASQEKHTFLTLFILSGASDNTTSQNIGGTDAWACPTSNFGRDRPTQSPLGLRPCLYYLLTLRVSQRCLSIHFTGEGDYYCIQGRQSWRLVRRGVVGIAGGRGRVVKYYYILSCTGSTFESDYF